MIYPRKLNDTYIQISVDNKEARVLAEWINYCAQHSNLPPEEVRRYRSIAADIAFLVENKN